MAIFGNCKNADFPVFTQNKLKIWSQKTKLKFGSIKTKLLGVETKKIFILNIIPNLLS